MHSRVPALAGAGLALLAFLVVGIHPALVYGSYAGALLAKGIFGSPLTGLLPGLLVGFGAAMGAVAVSGLFVVAGATVGTAVGALVGLFRKRPQAREDGAGPTREATPGPAAPAADAEANRGAGTGPGAPGAASTARDAAA